MASLNRDENHVAVIGGLSSTDGVTVIPVQVDPVTGALLCEVVDSTTSGAVSPRNIAHHDENHVPTMLAYNATSGLPQEVIMHNNYLAVQAN